MARRKQTEVAQPDVPLAIPVETATETPPPEQPAQPRNGEPRRPLQSWSIASDRTTRLEVTIWANMYKTNEGDEYEQLTIQVSRSYKTDQGWTKQEKPSFRVHDLPLLAFLIQKAMTFGYDRRTTDSNAPF